MTNAALSVSQYARKNAPGRGGKERASRRSRRRSRGSARTSQDRGARRSSRVMFINAYSLNFAIKAYRTAEYSRLEYPGEATSAVVLAGAARRPAIAHSKSKMTSPHSRRPHKIAAAPGPAAQFRIPLHTTNTPEMPRIIVDYAQYVASVVFTRRRRGDELMISEVIFAWRLRLYSPVSVLESSLASVCVGHGVHARGELGGDDSWSARRICSSCTGGAARRGSGWGPARTA